MLTRRGEKAQRSASPNGSQASRVYSVLVGDPQKSLTAFFSGIDTLAKQLAGIRPLWHVRLTVAHGKTAAAPRKPFGLRVRFSAQQAGQVSTQEPASPPTDSWPRSCLADEPSTLRRTTTANQLITQAQNTQRRRHRRITSSYLCAAVPTTQGEVAIAHVRAMQL